MIMYKVKLLRALYINMLMKLWKDIETETKVDSTPLENVNNFKYLDSIKLKKKTSPIKTSNLWKSE